MSAFLLVSTGGFIGANLRYWISLWATRRYGTDFPVGTLIANLCGSLLLGLVTGILAVSLAIWREWLEEHRPKDAETLTQLEPPVATQKKAG